jgi:hypothetical protein
MHLGDGLGAFGGTQDFWELIADLRSKKTEPHFLDFPARSPEFQKFFQIAGALHHVRGDGAVDGDTLIGDIFQDALVGGGCAPKVMFGLQTVDGDHDVQALEMSPVRMHFAESAGDDLDMSAARNNLRDQSFELAITDERVAADDGEVQGFFAIYYFQDAIDEGLTFAIVEIAEGLGAAEVRGVKGVATGTA